MTVVATGQGEERIKGKKGEISSRLGQAIPVWPADSRDKGQWGKIPTRIFQGSSAAEASARSLVFEDLFLFDLMVQ